MCKISIIIPVYQTELYVNQCLKSLLKQNIDDYEIICVDDGSMDNSKKVIESYCKRYSNVYYHYQQNSGVGSARNQGLRYARGKYIMFVDSDDHIKENTLVYLWNKAEKYNADILVFGGRTDQPLKSPEWIREGFYTKNVVYNCFQAEALFCNNGARPSVCNKMFKREILEGSFFPENIIRAEDLVFLCKVFPKAKNIVFVSKKIYRYRITNELSAMHRTKDDKKIIFFNHLMAAEQCLNFWKENGYLEAFSSYIKKWFIDLLKYSYRDLPEMDRTIYREQINRIVSVIPNFENWEAQMLIQETYHKKTVSRCFRLLMFHIKKYGLCGGIENIIYRKFYMEE